MDKWHISEVMESKKIQLVKEEIKKSLLSQGLTYDVAYMILGTVRSELEAKQGEEKVN